MSVDFNAILIYGWQVTEEEKEKINEYFNYRYEGNFCYSDYYDEESDVIFGKELLSNAGYALEINENKLKENKKETKKLFNLLKECGLKEIAEEEPKLYLVAQLA